MAGKLRTPAVFIKYHPSKKVNQCFSKIDSQASQASQTSIHSDLTFFAPRP